MLLNPRRQAGVLPVDSYSQMSTNRGQLQNWRRGKGIKNYGLGGKAMDAGAAIGDAYDKWVPEIADIYNIPLGMAKSVVDDVAQKTHDVMKSDPNDPASLQQASVDAFGLAADTMVGGSVAGLATKVPGKGTVLGSAVPPRLSDLPMDETSRMARADKMFPIEAYHGTNKDFTEFGKRGSATGAESAKKAYWFSDDPTTAASYSEVAGISDVQKLMNESRRAEASKQWDKANDLMRQAEKMDELDGKGENIIPARLGGNMKKVDMDGAKYDPDDHNLSDILEEAAGSGFDGVEFKNFSDEGGYGVYNPSTHYAVFDNKNIRSKHAKFDPARKDSASLLAANRSKGAGVLAASMQGEAKADILKKGGIWELSKIETPKGERGKGLATKRMKALIAEADVAGVPLALSPSSDFGSSKPKLTKWYKSLGFKPNKGRNKNFATRETMIRPAK